MKNEISRKKQHVLAILLLFTVINSTGYFLGILKVSFTEWILFNACAPSSLTFLIGYAVFLKFGNKVIMYISVLPVFFFGGLGMFVFRWNGFNLIPQISHVIMLLNIIVIIYNTLNEQSFKQAFIGLVIGIVIYSPFIGFQQNYVANHNRDFVRIMEVDIK